MLVVGGGAGRWEVDAGVWGESVPGGHGEGGHSRLMGLTVSTLSRGLRRALRGGERVPRGVGGARRPVFPGREEGQKSRRVTARLRRVEWAGGIATALAALQGRTGEAMVSGR